MAAQSNKDDSNLTAYSDVNIVTLTFQGIVINENKQNSIRTKLIQLMDQNGKLTTQLMTTSNKVTTLQNNTKLPRKTAYQERILHIWLRETTGNMNEYVSCTALIDQNVLSLIITYSAFEIGIRLTRPLSVGVRNDMHHLHIRQIEVYSKSLAYCRLTFKEGSECVTIGSNGKTPLKCIDGDRSSGSFNHSDYSNRTKSNSQKHWMEFVIDGDKHHVADINDIDHVVIYNRTACSSRLRGCILSILRDGRAVKTWTVRETKHVYKFVMTP
eukprot:1127442_1